MSANFSWITIIMLFCGWLTHWLITVRKAKKASASMGTSVPSMLSYWYADIESTVLSVIGVLVFYFALPSIAMRFPEVAAMIGSTVEDPLNPLAAYLGGLAAPVLGDWAGKRITNMIKD